MKYLNRKVIECAKDFVHALACKDSGDVGAWQDSLKTQEDLIDAVGQLERWEATKGEL
jgi:hypothetical protein